MMEQTEGFWIPGDHSIAKLSSGFLCLIPEDFVFIGFVHQNTKNFNKTIKQLYGAEMTANHTIPQDGIVFYLYEYLC